jgi:hypothetical protein
MLLIMPANGRRDLIRRLKVNGDGLYVCHSIRIEFGDLGTG